ncbi:DUF2242 domain-containing protein [Pseudomonas sp. UBA6562]|uniref:DUF2242 domain-containing protein n=1 Tax=Pseudomonas sp. UBA6562 TaxID=1947332 RepID=UPI0025EFEF1D|nr:DUF2242 domain-containing protein [Pseudomonas sp. UBA6562]
MSRSSALAVLGLAFCLAGASGCASKKAAIYEHENFDNSGTYSRSFPVNEAGSCEAARRALLSQGYIITSSDANQVAGNKSFQQNSENHLQISFNVTCAPDSSDEQRSTMFANALQDRYSLKKSNTSASLGVGILGSVSMPIGSSDDSMVKVASETVTAAQFYDRYFALVESYLPKPKKAQSAPAVAPLGEAAKAPASAPDLGLPEPASAPAADNASTPVAGNALAAGAQTAAAAAQVGSPQATPAVDDSQGSQPIAPPAAGEPIQVMPEPQTQAVEASPAVETDSTATPVTPPVTQPAE